MAVDHSAIKLGLKPPKPELLARLPGMKRLGVPLPQAAPSCDWSGAVKQWGMDDNKTIGDCTIASVDHCRRVWHANCGMPYKPAGNDELVAAYSRVSGYDPRDPSTDTGAHWSDVLEMWRTEGFILGAVHDKIEASVALDTSELNELRLAVQWFGAAPIGVCLPVSAQGQDAWIVVPGDDGGVWGGHAIPVVAYDQAAFYVVSWGKVMPMTPEFFLKYAMEGYGVVSRDWIAESGRAPSNLDLAGLTADLDALAV